MNLHIIWQEILNSRHYFPQFHTISIRKPALRVHRLQATLSANKPPALIQCKELFTVISSMQNLKKYKWIDKLANLNHSWLELGFTLTKLNDQLQHLLDDGQAGPRPLLRLHLLLPHGRPCRPLNHHLHLVVTCRLSKKAFIWDQNSIVWPILNLYWKLSTTIFYFLMIIVRCWIHPKKAYTSHIGMRF